MGTMCSRNYFRRPSLCTDIQATLFDDPVDQAKSDSMMSVMDTINRKMGKGTLAIAASGITKQWAMRRERKSPNYTTEWDELPEAR